jgi:hypothetical protein
MLSFETNSEVLNSSRRSIQYPFLESYNKQRLSRKLKKSTSIVLASLRGLNLEESFSEAGSDRGDFPFAKIHPNGRTVSQSAVRTSSPLCSLRPC